MRPLHTLLFLLVLAALGAGGWWLLGGGNRPPAYAPAVPESALEMLPPAEEEPQLRAPALTTGKESASERTSAEVLPEQVVPARGPAARNPTAGGSSVHGVVLDDRGHPVAGAQVLAVSGTRIALGSLPLDSRGMDRVGWMKRESARTDQEGRFELKGLAPGQLRIAVRASGYAPLDNDQLALPAEPRHELEPLRLLPGVFVEGRVVDAAGRGIAGAEIARAQGSDSPLGRSFVVPVTTTGPDGRFLVDQLASGPFELRVTHEAHPTTVAKGTTARPGERVRDLRIELPDGAWIRGRVSGAPAAELGRLQVAASPDAGGFGFGMSGDVRRAKVEADGSFALGGLWQDKRYALTLQRQRQDGVRDVLDWMGPGLSEPVRASPGDAGVELRWQPGATLTARVVDAQTRQPIESLEVEGGLEWPMPLLDPESGQPQRKFPDGRVRFDNLRAPSPQSRARVRIAATGYQTFEREGIALTPGQDTDLGEIALELSALVRVRVLDDVTGEPLEGARVTLTREEPEEPGVMRRSIRVMLEENEDEGGHALADDARRSARSDKDGLALLSSFPGQSCVLQVSHPEHAPYRSETFTAAVDGHTERSVRMTLGGTVEVQLKRRDGAPIAGGRIEHRPPGAGGAEFPFANGGSARGVTNSEGMAVFSHLQAGVHRFRPAGGGSGGVLELGGDRMAFFEPGMEVADDSWTEVEVQEGASVRIALEAPVEGSLVGRVREGGSALAGAKLSLGKRGQGERWMLPGIMGGGAGATSDGEGSYRLEHVRAGSYTLSISHPTRAMVDTLEVEVGEGEQRLDIELAVAIVEGRVLDEQGEPVVGARVWAAKAAPKGSGGQQRAVVRMIAMADGGGGSVVSLGEDPVGPRVITDEKGRFSLRGVLPDVDLEVLADASSFQPVRSEPFQVAPDEVRRGVELQAKLGGSIEVVISGAEGRSMLAVARQVDPPKGSRSEPRTIMVGAEGTGTLNGLAPGTWTVRLNSFGPGGDGNPPSEQSVEVQAGKSARASFTLP